MAECIKCRLFQLCPWATPPEIICSSFKPKTITNADRIRAMTDEELAEWLIHRVMCTRCPKSEKCKSLAVGTSCEGLWLGWLKQEASE